MYDVVIIGAGVSGSAIARELSRYQVNACVVEKAEDVCCGTSKANSAIVHAGFDAENGSLMADLNVKGNVMMEDLSKELDFSFRKNGSLVICLHEEDRPNLEALFVDTSEGFSDKFFLEIHFGCVEPCNGSIPIQYSPVTYFGSSFQLSAIEPIR